MSRDRIILDRSTCFKHLSDYYTIDRSEKLLDLVTDALWGATKSSYKILTIDSNVITALKKAGFGAAVIGNLIVASEIESLPNDTEVENILRIIQLNLFNEFNPKIVSFNPAIKNHPEIQKYVLSLEDAKKIVEAYKEGDGSNNLL